MKKTMSILLALVMVLSIMAFAVAAEESTDVPVEELEETSTSDGELNEETEPADEEPVEELEETAETVEEVAEDETPVEEEETVEEEAVEDATEEVVEEETAEEEEVTEEEPLLEVDEGTAEDAGTTPDSFMWNLDKAMEQLDLLLTFDESEEAMKQIEIAKERLAEVKVMLSENNLEDAETAQEAHDDILADVEETINELSDSDAEEELAAVEEIEDALADHEEDVIELGEHISVSVKGQLTEEHQAQLNEMLQGFNDSTGKVQATVQAKKNKVKVKVKIIEDAENGHGKKVTVQHTDLMKTNQGNGKNKAAVDGEAEESDGEESTEAAAEKTKGKPEKSKGKK